MVMAPLGNSNPDALIAARIRSSASLTAPFGNPTTVFRGIPGIMLVSTATDTVFIPDVELP